MADLSLKELMKQRVWKLHEEVVEKDTEVIRCRINYEPPQHLPNRRVAFMIRICDLMSEAQAGLDWDERMKNLAVANPGTTYRLHTQEIGDDEDRVYLVVETVID